MILLHQRGSSHRMMFLSLKMKYCLGVTHTLMTQFNPILTNSLTVKQTTMDTLEFEIIWIELQLLIAPWHIKEF